MIESLPGLLALMQSHGATRFYVKKLAPNDNSKNQIYLGSDFSALNIIPHGSIRSDNAETAGSKRERAKADIPFFWIDDIGLHVAPHAQLILYPKYPEVRMSGFLKGSRASPNAVLTTREEGRVLVMGMTRDGQVLGYAALPSSPIAKEIHSRTNLVAVGVFHELPPESDAPDTRTILLERLAAIYRKHWIPSRILTASGGIPYSARNGGGYTLEAELGILPNGYADPDFLGWEVKQYGVSDFVRYTPRSPVTLMTPEPTAGIYREEGPESFVRRFGYADNSGIVDRLNFGGVHSCTSGFHPRTGLRLALQGYDQTTGKITDINGGVVLVSRNDDVAALWRFTGMMEHWSRKHAQAAYVPSLARTPPPEYWYGPRVLLCEKTDFSLLLEAFVEGAVYYDPGIKLEHASSDKPTLKRRSQFRIKHHHLPRLYKLHEIVVLKD